MSFNIAIDGPAGAGKSTIAKLAAKELSFIYVDTGAMYRTIALGLLRAGTDIEDAAALEKQLSDIEVTISYENGVQQVFLNGENVTGLIRTEQVSDMTSRSSAKPQVRAKLTELQVIFFTVPLQCSLDDVAQIGRFLSDPCDRVFDGVIIFQNLRNAVVRCRAVF